MTPAAAPPLPGGAFVAASPCIAGGRNSRIQSIQALKSGS